VNGKRVAACAFLVGIAISGHSWRIRVEVFHDVDRKRSDDRWEPDQIVRSQSAQMNP